MSMPRMTTSQSAGFASGPTQQQRSPFASMPANPYAQQPQPKTTQQGFTPLPGAPPRQQTVSQNDIYNFYTGQGFTQNAQGQWTPPPSQGMRVMDGPGSGFFPSAPRTPQPQAPSDPRRNLQPPTMPTPRPMPQSPGMAQPIQPPSQGAPYTPPEIRRPAQTWTQGLREQDAMRARQPQFQPTPQFGIDPATGRRLPPAQPGDWPIDVAPATGRRLPPQQPQFSASYGGLFGGQSATPQFAQRDALIQRLNDTMLPYQLGQATGRPQFNMPALWSQAGQMVQNGWQNPFAMR